MRKHADGRILNDRGETIGRWDDNVHGVRQWAISHGEDPDDAEEAWRRRGQSHRPVVRRVEGYYEANKHRADRGHGKNWLRVLNAFGQYQERGIKPFSAAEAHESAKVWGGWKEVALALEGLELANFEFAYGYDPAGSVYAEDGADGYVAPDDERWGNERESEDNAASQIAAEHVEQFVAYIERERDLAAEVNGSGHPVVKNRVHDAWIVDVRSGEPVHSQIMFLYGQFCGWLRGDHGQRCAGEITLWADGTEDDHSDAAFRVEQEAYVAEVERFQSARDSGDPDAQQGFDEWRRPNRVMFPFNGTYVEDTRSGCVISYDRVAQRRDELTADNVRYRLDCNRPDGIRQISWLALNYEGCLCWLPHYDAARAETTRMIPADEVPDLIAEGWRILTAAEYTDNQRVKNARENRFSAFRLWVQHDPRGNPLGVCPTQHDSGGWVYNTELFARLRDQAAEEIAPADVPADIADAIAAGDWAEVARLAALRAGQ